MFPPTASTPLQLFPGHCIPPRSHLPSFRPLTHPFFRLTTKAIPYSARATLPDPPLLLPPPITGNPRLCPGPPPLLPAGGAATDLMTLQQGNQHLYARDATILTTYASALEE